MEPMTVGALGRMLEPLDRALSVEAARALAALEIDAALAARIEELADRCTEGQLTDDERAEYEAYVEGAEILALIRLRARRFLDERGAA